MTTIPSTMAAVLLTGHGGLDMLEYREDVPVPDPAPGEVLIRVAAAGVNNTDINTRIGWYSKKVTGATSEGPAAIDASDASWAGVAMTFPRIQGADCCGRVVATGEGVDPARMGERVIVRSVMPAPAASSPFECWTFGSECDGAFAQFAVAPSAEAYAVTSDWTDVELASVPCAWSTAENMLERAGVGVQRILVTGASGGVGSAAVQLARHRGATVIAVAAAAKAEGVLALGASEVIDRDADPAAVLGEESVDAVIDVVGGAVWPRFLDILKRGGRYATSGAISGPLVELDLRTLYLKDLTLVGCTAQDDIVFDNLVRAVEEGAVRPWWPPPSRSARSGRHSAPSWPRPMSASSSSSRLLWRERPGDVAIRDDDRRNVTVPVINGDRLLRDLETLRTFGKCGNGVVRQSLSEVDMESRRWLVERMADAGLDARIDGIGTVFGRSRNPGKALLVGSHTDTQPTGGWLDGTLGVMYGLETVRAFAESRETRDLAVDVASWIDEEGTFFGLLGSKMFCGLVGDAELDGAGNACGRTLRAALRDAGLEGSPVERCVPDRYRAYMEAHIEQGPWLEEEKRRIGVVTGIVGIRDLLIRFEGQQNHAGTTPMARRRDAGAALVAFASRVHEVFAAHAGPRSVWTIGNIRLEPGAASIIPGRAWLTLQYRDADEARMDRFRQPRRGSGP